MKIFAGAVIAIVLGAVIGIPAYQMGLSQGLAQTGALAPSAYPYYAGWHGGFGGFGFVFPLLFVFLFFGVLRGAFGGGWRHRGWYGRGQYTEVPPQVADLHRRLHEADTKTDAGTAGKS